MTLPMRQPLAATEVVPIEKRRAQLLAEQFRAAEEERKQRAESRKAWHESVFAASQDSLVLAPSEYLRWPWSPLDTALSGLRPGKMAFVCAPPEGGKTSFLLSLVEAWLAFDDIRVVYAGLETPPADLVMQMAAMRCGLPYEWFATGSVWERPEPWRDFDAMEEAMAAIKRDSAGRLFFAEEEALTPKAVRSITELAMDVGAHVVIYDHIDHVAPGPNGKTPAEHSAVLEAVALWQKRAAAGGHKFRWLCASQLNNENTRRGGVLGRAMPPAPSDVYMGGRKEQLADLFLGLHRVRRPPTDDDQRVERDIKLGLRPVTDLLIPDVMGVRIMKRRAGGRSGMTIRLPFRDGKVVAPLRFDRIAHNTAIDTMEVDDA